MIVFSVILFRSCELGFPRLAYQNDTAQATTTTKAGTSKYMLCGITDGLKDVYDIHIPDIVFPINIGVTALDFSLKGIKIANLNVPNVVVDLNGHNDVAMSALNCSVLITFEWGFQQSSYPFIKDIGTGKVIVNNAIMTGLVGSDVNRDDCPGHFIVNFIKASIDYEYFKIQLDGGSSWIFQSFIDVVMGAIEDNISGLISDVIMKGVVALINNVFEDGRREKSYADYPNIIKDGRYTTGALVGVGFVTLQLTGYVYSKSNYSDEYMSANKLSKITYNKFNDDIQLAVHAECFNNAFYILNKYENVYSPPGYVVTVPPKIEFANVAAILSMQLLFNSSYIDIKLLAKPLHDDYRDNEVGIIYFKFSQYSIQSENPDLILDSIQSEIVEWMNNKSRSSSFQFSFTHMIDIRTLQLVVDAQEQVVRLVGTIPDGCTKI
ncbi:Conserved_hypothetical protein [Hexamita inflata]|uniref:Uncharacterized protein n=1 Tax=Hexamita inflata TaxID=28002 RepID=A0AA86U6D5_9EUKA|nr:Conserved hypothetical protein [Hexamita inflata]